MTIRDNLKELFSTGKKPTGAHFAELIDSLNVVDNPLRNEISMRFGASPKGAVARNGDVSSTVNRTSTFSGHGSLIGPRQNFDAVRFYLSPFDATSVPTAVRVKIRQGKVDGTVLADVTVPLPDFTVAESHKITVELGTVIENAAGDNLFFEFTCNGRVGQVVSTTSVTNTGDDKPYYSNSASLIDTPMTLVSSIADPRQTYVETFLSGTTNVFASGTRGSAQRTSSTFSGHGNVLEAIPPTFNTCQLFINAFNANALPTQVRLRFRKTDQNGEVLATTLTKVVVSKTGNHLVTFVFPVPVDLPDDSWMEVLADGHIGICPNQALGSTFGMYSTSRSTDGSCRQVVSGGAYHWWFRTALIDVGTQRDLSIGDIQRLASEASPTVSATPICDLTLPPNIYAVEGVEMNIYWDGIFNSWLRPDRYSIRVACGVGRHDDARWRIVPDTSGYGPRTTTDIGNHAMTIEAIYNGTIAASASATIRVKAAATGEGATRKCLVIGDSTTAPGSITSQLLSRVADNPTSYELSLLGTQGSDSNKHEGHSGKTYSWLRTDPLSPFVFSGAFNFAQYLSTNSYTMSSGDSVFLLMGINDLFGHASDVAADGAITSIGGHLTAIINNIQSAVTGINVWVGLVIPPSHDQSAFGNNYLGSTQYRDRYNRNIGLWRRHLIATYGSSSTIKLAPVNCNLDTVHNMVRTEESVNAHNTDKVQVQSNGVHPSTSGYKQIGDTLYACLMSLEA